MDALAIKNFAWPLFIGILGVAFLLSLYMVFLVKGMALRHGLYDQPNARSMHVKPIPRLGGLGIVIAFFLAIGGCSLLRQFMPDSAWLIRVPDPQILLGGLLLAAVGLWDDIKGMRARTKLLFQIAAAIVAVAGGARFSLPAAIIGDMGAYGDLLSAGATVLWIVLLINAVNLIDGLDGLAAGVSIIGVVSVTIAFALKGYGPDFVFVAIFVGSLLGFLAHNRYPAAIFMGDCGSLFLGYMLATFALPVTAKPDLGLTILVPVVAFGLPLLDTTLAVLRRAAEQRAIFSADKDHIHHRVAMRLGLGHQHTVLALYGISLCFGALSVLLSISGTSPLLALTLALLGILVFFLLIKLGYLKPIADEHQKVQQPQRVPVKSH